KLRAYLTDVADKQLQELRPADGTKLAEYRRIVGGALRAMTTSGLPEPREVEARAQGSPKLPGVTAQGYLIGRRGQGEQVPALWLRGKDFNGTAVVWVDPAGKSSLVSGEKLTPAAQAILDKGSAILAIDAFDTGELAREKPLAVNGTY